MEAGQAELVSDDYALARYPELSPRFDVDRDASAKTRRSFPERYCDTRTLCCAAISHRRR
jgi:hypothetical protein